jgi:hypothetical protein
MKQFHGRHISLDGNAGVHHCGATVGGSCTKSTTVPDLCTLLALNAGVSLEAFYVLNKLNAASCKSLQSGALAAGSTVCVVGESYFVCFFVVSNLFS